MLKSGEKLSVTLSGKTFDVLITFLNSNIIDQAAASGLFTLIDSENLIRFSRKIGMYNLEVKHLLSILPAGLSDNKYHELLKHAIVCIENTCKAIIDDCEQICKNMKLKFTDSIGFVA